MNDLAALTEKAERGDADAQFALGRSLHAGAPGVAPSLPKAINWYFKAASQNHIGAQLCLGLLLLDDVEKAGGKRNPKQALQWLGKAAQAGNSDAQYRPRTDAARGGRHGQGRARRHRMAGARVQAMRDHLGAPQPT